ncbi:MAG TPA: hypothetical protein EYO96_05320 [Candidatus Marinimicrobia bacterium]|jgi:hypothetical protein|nr:hypothetical protein [Candidatus Neomarinimicrobiota bacterium]
MARIKQMAEQMDISIDKAEELANRASEANEELNFKIGGVAIPDIYSGPAQVRKLRKKTLARLAKEEKRLEKQTRQLIGLGTAKKKDKKKILMQHDALKEVFVGAKGGIVRGTRAQVRGRRFSGVY